MSIDQRVSNDMLNNIYVENMNYLTVNSKKW